MKQDMVGSCDIFCSVVDNFGDIGVSWRLARLLAAEYSISVRLWVDDLGSFKQLCPTVDALLATQRCKDVEIHLWTEDFPGIEPAELVVETFACKLPPAYLQAMIECENKPVWINLEYLSAEPWVAGCHGLPSPQPGLPLVKYFYFPGFTLETGGLLLERDLLARREAFLADQLAKESYWKSLGVPPRVTDELRISIFTYENNAIENLLECMAAGNSITRCMIPEGRVLPQVAAFFGLQSLQAGDIVSRDSLYVHVLPFVEQEAYDLLLWSCDLNFVRGEDSCVRALWAAKPFVWHIYPQHDGVHMKKLQAFLDLYGARLDPEARSAMQEFWLLWNQGDSADALNVGVSWNNFMSNRSTLVAHANVWVTQLATNNLALNLLDFSRKVGTMRAFENQAGR